MARKRMVDPEFWLDEEITSLGFEFRLFYIGTWNFADDYGVVENSAKKLKAQVFPYDDVDCEPMITKLIKLGKFIEFEAEGKKWLFIKKFLKYQRVDKPSRNRNPETPKEILGEDSTTTQELLHDEVKLSKEKLSEVKSIYTPHGEFKKVLLTSEEYEKLKLRYGEKNTEILIAELDTGIASKGYKYKNHYATILNWARRKFQEHQSKKQLKGKQII